jgi:hypothetical protein
MKKVIIISFLGFCCLLIIEAGRIIQMSDIVNWCIESDLILTASISKLNTIVYDTNESYLNNGWYFRCISGREQYFLEIDSFIKGEYKYDSLTVYTPVTCIYHTKYRKTKKYIEAVQDFYDDSWFRLKNGDKRIILLSNKNKIYEVLYRMEIKKTNFDLIDSIKVKGKDYQWFHPINEKK